MDMYLSKKALVVGITILFVGAGFVLGISGDLNNFKTIKNQEINNMPDETDTAPTNLSIDETRDVQLSPAERLKLENRLENEVDEGCAGIVATGSCVKDGRSIFWKTRHRTENSPNKIYFYSGSTYSGDFDFITVGNDTEHAKMGINQVGLAMGGFTADSPVMDSSHWQYTSTRTRRHDSCMRYALANFCNVSEAAMYIATNVNMSNNKGSNLGIVSQESGVGAIISIQNVSGTVYTHITWVNNSWQPIDNSLHCEGICKDDDGNGQTIYDIFYNVTTGAVNSSDGDHLINWKDVCQWGAKNVSGQELSATGTIDTRGEISRNRTWSAFVAVSGNDSYDGSANTAWVQIGRQTLVGAFFPIAASYITKDSDIPTYWTYGISGDGMEEFMGPKVNYASSDGMGFESREYDCVRTREILHYTSSIENHSFDEYDDIMSSIMTSADKAEVKSRLQNFADGELLLGLNHYVINETWGENPVHNIDRRTSHATLASAISSANTGDTLIIIDDVTLNENVVINKQITLMGGDKDTSKIQGSSSSDTITVNADGVIIKNLTIKGGNNAIVRVTGYTCIIQNTKIEGSPSKGIYLASASSYCTIKNNFLDDCYIYCEQTDHNTITENYITGNSYGIHLDSSTYHTITKNNIRYNSLDGIVITGYSTNNEILENNIENNYDYGINIIGGTSNTIQNNDVIGNDEVGIGLTSSDAFDNDVYYNEITDNHVSGIEISGGVGNTVFGNDVINNRLYGIKLSSAVENTVQENNVYYNNPYGFYIEYSTDNDILDNDIADNTGYGIYLHLSCSHNNITNNDIYAEHEYGIYLAPYGTYNNIKDNTILNITNNGININGDHNFVIGNTIVGHDNISLINTDDYGVAYLGSYHEIKDNSISYRYDGIHLKATVPESKYNVIQGNTVFNNTHAGVYLMPYSDNYENDVIGNTITNNSYYGIYVEGRWYLIQGNIIDDHQKGICVRYQTSAWNDIVGNNVTNTTEYGIFCEGQDCDVNGNNISDGKYGIYLSCFISSTNQVNENNVTDNSNYGIYVSGTNCDITGNTVARNNGAGISVIGSNSINHTISWNDINNNSGAGISIKSGTDSHNIYWNVIHNNAGPGINLPDSDENIVHNNTIMDLNFNGINLSSDSTNNDIYDNTVIRCSNGIVLSSSSDNNVVGNDAINCSDGILITSSSNNDIINNDAHGNTDGTGIKLSSANYNDIISDSAHENKYGLYLESSSNNTIIDCNFSDNLDSGVFITSNSNDNELTNVTANRHTRYGFIIDDSTHNDITDSTANENSWYGVMLNYVNYSNLINNTITQITNNPGIKLFYSNNNKIIDNNASNNHEGIHLEYSWYNNMTNNSLNENTEYAIYLDESDHNDIVTNIANEDSKTGIYLKGSDWNTIIGNDINNNDLYGIFLQHDNNYNSIENNTANNTDFGIRIYNGDYNLLYGNWLNDTLRSIMLESVSDNNIIKYNNATYSTYGIYIKTGGSNQLIGNDCSHNNKGIFLDNSNNNNPIFGNKADNNSVNGIVLHYSSFNHLEKNTASNNSENGIIITLGSNQNTLVENTANDNGKTGIYLNCVAQNTVDLSTVKENGNFDIKLSVNNNNHCTNNLMGNIGSGGGFIEYFNMPFITLPPGTYSELILCQADNFVCDNVVIAGSSTLKNNGILMFNTNDSQLSNITSSNNRLGIQLEDSNRNHLVDSVFNNNALDGMKFLNSHNNIVSNCTINSNDDDGFTLSGNDNEIDSCTIQSNADDGMPLGGNSNNISYCNISYNVDGISMGEGPNNNMIFDNNITGNSQYGVLSIQAYSNTFWHNNFKNNYINNSFDTGNNAWDRGYYSFGGNYWDDYTGVDTKHGPDQDKANSDEIGDTPYPIPGGSLTDNYPFMESWNGTLPPCMVVFINPDPLPDDPGWQISIFDRIQDGIDAVAPGGTVVVSSGTYNENLVINKQIALEGQSKDDTVVDGDGTDTVINIAADYVSVSGFTIQNSALGGDAAGVLLNGNFVTIRDNKFINNNLGVSLPDASNNFILENHFENNFIGVITDINSIFNEIYHNNFVGNNQNAYDETMGDNQWDDLMGQGNYWDDFEQNPGFIDGQYWIPPYYDSKDYFPLWDPDSWNLRPFEPANPLPDHQSLNVPIDIDLTWSGGDLDPGDLVDYEIYFGTDPDPPWIEDIYGYPSEQTEITWNPGSLEYDTTYYWRIIARDSMSKTTEGAFWQFTTMEGDNMIVENTWGYRGDTNKQIYINGTWTDSLWSYKLAVFYDTTVINVTTATFQDTVGETANSQNAYIYPEEGVVIASATWSYDFPPAGSGPLLKIYVDISEDTQVDQTLIYLDDSPLTPTYQDCVYFYYPGYLPIYPNLHNGTLAILEFPNDPPNEPTNPDPEDGLDDIIPDDVTLYWSGGDSDTDDTVIYEVYFGTNSDPPLVHTTTSYPWDQTEINWNIGQLEYNTMYYWKIIAEDSHGETTESELWSFTTEEEPNNPPNAPSNPTPNDGSYDQNLNTILSWSCDDPDEDPLTFDVYFGTDSSPSQVVSDHLESSYNPGILDYETTYYWKIIARDIHNASTDGPIWSVSSKYIGVDIHTVALWHFDEGTGSTLYDETDNDNDGTRSGTSWTTGKYGPCLNYGGSGYVTIPHSSSLDITRPFRIEAWINCTAPNPYYYAIVDKYHFYSGTDERGFTFHVNDDNKLRLTVYSGSNNGGAIGTTNIRDSKWHHVVGEWDGNYIRLYVDGIMERENEYTYPPASTTDNLGIGKRLSGHGGTMEFIGRIDEVRISVGMNDFILNLVDFPMYKADSYPGVNEMCGPAVAQMNLDYMWWNSSSDPTPPKRFDDQLALYYSGIENNSNISLPYFDAQGMWHTIQYNKPMPYSEYGYNFGIYHNTDSDYMLAQICKWINYTAGRKPGYPVHVPGAVPVYGDYSNWLSVRGFRTNHSAYPLPSALDIFGFWVNDPRPSSLGGIGENSYKMAGEWLSTYYQPVDVVDDPYKDEYVAICEPPLPENECDVTIVPSPERWGPLDEPPGVRKGKMSSSFLNQVSDDTVVRAAIDGVTGLLIPYDDDFADVFEQSYPGRPILVKNLAEEKGDFYVVPFTSKPTTQPIKIDTHQDDDDEITMVVVLVDANDGHFKEASWVQEPVKYLPILRTDALDIVFDELRDMGINPEDLNAREIKTDLVYQDSTPYYPDWRVIISELGMEFFVSQDGTISYDM